ncbi:ABC transporter ATP-binding protein [Carboxylicivirga mesophila]|uniref:ABC transporter ATP-binding protein n=1 Tax=Carboxylicivirga mesophila TaxID=1166478 RepID=A0ABS5KAZ3_9BACT|nr:ABC transporter ATP-binding protein [Carboxylicivirga mesophila]MBS2212111.1 ABC transporter ATP-binding protein [Carboxylicivirga mesophila]
MKQTSIHIRGLRKSFGKGADAKEVLKGIDLSIESGQIIGYIGPNGAGKSTTVKILCGILTSFEGDIEVMGIPLRNNAIEVKRKIGYVPENGALYEALTPAEYLNLVGTLFDMSSSLIGERTDSLLKYFEMSQHANQRMDTFSKGMKQKILIIAGLINNPDILFLDEPLSGLDANSVILVKDMLTRLAKQGKTIFYSSHLMDVVEKISDRIILIDNGQVIADGTFEELQQDSKASLEQVFAKLTGGEERVGESGILDEVFKN